MYWATSFWEREKSSKRERMYAESACREFDGSKLGAVAAGDLVGVIGCFIGSPLIRRSPRAFLQGLVAGVGSGPIHDHRTIRIRTQVKVIV